MNPIKKTLLIFSLLLISQLSSAYTWNAVNDGDWNDDNTWKRSSFMWQVSGHPQSGDIAVIKNGFTIRVGNSDAICDSLYIENYDNNTLIINSGKSLTVNTGIYVNYYDDDYDYDCYIKVYGTLNVTNDIYIKRNLNTWNEVQLYVSNGTISVGGDIIYNYIDGPEWEGYKEFKFINASQISCNNFSFIHTDDNNRGLPEIYLSGSSQLDVSENFSVNVSNGEGYRLTMKNSSQININGNSIIDVTANSGYKNIYLKLSGTSAYKIGINDASLSYRDSILLKDGRNLKIKLSDDATYTVYGNQIFEHSGNTDFFLTLNDGTNGSNNDAQLDIKNNLSINLSSSIRDPYIHTYHDADIKVGGNLSVTIDGFKNTSSDLIFDLNEESGITVEENTTINFSATGSDNSLNINIDDDAFWKTTGDVTFNYDGNNDLLINLNQSADGSTTDAQITASGNMIFNAYTSLRYFKILMNNDADIKVDGNLTFILSDNEDWEDNTISIADNAGITVGGNCSLSHTSTEKSSLDINLYNNAFWTVGTSGHTSDNFTINYDAADKMTFTLYDNSKLTVYGDFTMNRKDGDTGTNSALHQYASSHVTIYNDLILKNTQDTKLLNYTLGDNAILEVRNDIDFSSALSDSRLQIETWSSSKLYIGGNFLRNSSHKYGVLSCNETSTLYYNGTSKQQEIAANVGNGSDNFTYANLVLDNTTSSAPQFTMEGTSEIRDGYNLKFTDGIVSADATHYFKVLDNATVSDASNTSFVDGYIHKIGNDAFIFPTGNSGMYVPSQISAPSNTTDEFAARYRYEDPDNAGDRTQLDVTLNHISRVEYWDLDRIAGSSSVNITLGWDDPRSSGVDDLSELRIAHWDGSLWQDYGNNATTGNTTTGTITVNNISSFSPFTLASISVDNPLPIELLSFDAKVVKQNVNIDWITSSEINNDYFIIEKSKDGIYFNEINQITGAGNSNTELYYSSIDKNPYNGISYYRLKQIDFDGSFTYSDLKAINFASNIKNINFYMYPNPVNSENNINISISNYTKNSKLYVYNITGTKIISNYIIQDNHINLDRTLFKKGTYIVSIVTENTTINKKLIIQ